MIRLGLVDDQALVRTGLRMVLEAEPDIEVGGEAADGRQAIEAARLAPDLFLMDIRMPNMDGIEATRRLAGPGGGRPGQGAGPDDLRPRRVRVRRPSRRGLAGSCSSTPRPRGWSRRCGRSPRATG